MKYYGTCSHSPLCDEDRCSCDVWEFISSLKYQLYDKRNDIIFGFTNVLYQDGMVMYGSEVFDTYGKAFNAGGVIPAPMNSVGQARNQLLPRRTVTMKCQCPEPFTYFIVKWRDGQTSPQAHKQYSSRPFDMRKMQKAKAVQVY